MNAPQFEGLDLYEAFDENWNPVHLSGKMPSPKWEKDANGREVFGYKQLLTPIWQSDVITAYKQVRGELAKPENINRKAVVDMNLDERLKEVWNITYEKGYISKEIKEQLGSITAQEAIATFGLGGILALLAGTETGAALAGPVGVPVGGVLTAAYIAKRTTEFGAVTEEAAKAIDRKGLDKAAQEFGKWLGQLSRDGVLAIIGAAGGVTASREMPIAQKAIDSAVSGAKQVISNIENTRLPILGEPIPATPNGAPIKSPSKSGNITEPEKPVVMEIRGDRRINIRKGSGKTGTGMEYAWRRHGGSGSTNKSQFTIPRNEVELLLQQKYVIKSPAVKDPISNNYIREVDVGKIVGNLPIDKGGQPTSFITVITDEAGNLVNVFPGKLGFKAN